MILFVCSIVASTVGYLRRRRMGQWIKNLTADACCDGKQLIFRRISTSSVQPWRNPRTHGIYGVRSSDESTSLLWSADDSEVLLSERRVSYHSTLSVSILSDSALLLSPVSRKTRFLGVGFGNFAQGKKKNDYALS